jgi:CheY-like chemotaxis protein
MGRPRNALIVDDEPHVRAYAKLLLREAGIDEVWEAADGGQAIAALEAHEPELVLLDVNLPVLSGLEVLRQLKEAGWTTPVIMLTAENATKTVQEAAKQGARGYLLKYSPRDEALADLRAVLDELEDESAANAPGAPPK